MTRTAENQDQAAIERKAKEFVARGPFRPEQTVEELFGSADSWMLSIGDYRLILIPAVWQWWYHDRIHDSWEDTGYDVGEATFAIRNGELSPPRKKRQQAQKLSPMGSPSFAKTKTCPHCGSTVPLGNKSCTICGSPVDQLPKKQPLSHCPGCGKEVRPGKQFCFNCGTRLQ